MRAGVSPLVTEVISKLRTKHARRSRVVDIEADGGIEALTAGGIFLVREILDEHGHIEPRLGDTIEFAAGVERSVAALIRAGRIQIVEVFSGLVDVASLNRKPAEGFNRILVACVQPYFIERRVREAIVRIVITRGR